MKNQNIPWKHIIEFHREIAIRSEASFFSFGLDDHGSERFSYMNNKVVRKMQVDARIKTDVFSNLHIFSNLNQKNSEFYIGGIFWFTNKLVDGNWIKVAHPLFYKPFNIKKDLSERFDIEPEQAKWDISPMFYKLLDKKGVVLEENLDEVLLEMIESVAQNSTEGNFDGKFLSKFTAKFPELKKEFVDNVPLGFEKRWLAFVAPKDFSAIQRNLILDYSKLIEKLDENNDVLGGFELFEKRKISKIKTVPVMPIVPLNDNQLEVVEKVISGNEITVVSGPPGCGKSQVVISMLLNAWEKGQSALFASSNNQAVAVVRERMRQFEKAVPMVVRCGARKTSELMITLSNMISIIDNYDGNNRHLKSAEEIAQLEESLQSITELLNSNLPQRIDELARAALGAYGRAGEYRDSWKAEYALYEERLKGLRISCGIDNFITDAYEPFNKWIEMHVTSLESIKKDNEDRRNLNSKIGDLRAQVESILETDYQQVDGERKITEEKLEEVLAWYAEYRDFLLQFVEADLQDIDWHTDFEEWKSVDDVAIWIKNAEEYIEYYKKFVGRYSGIISDINAKQQRSEHAKHILASNNIKELTAEKKEALGLWVELYNRYMLTPRKIGDRLPFSVKSKQDKLLTEYEMEFVDVFGPTYLSDYAPDPVKRRKYISVHADELFEDYIARRDLSADIDKLNTLHDEQKKLNDLITSIGFTSIESVLNEAECKRKTEEVKAKINVAKKAKVAFEKRDRKDSVIKHDRELKFTGSQLLYPLMAGIKQDSDVNRFFELLNNNIYGELTLDLLKKSRDITYKHTVESYLERLKKACKLWDEADETFASLNTIKEEAKYHLEWMQACPKHIKGAFSRMSYQSMVSAAESLNANLDEIYTNWVKEGRDTIEQLKANEAQEYDWAWNSIKKALDLCPENILPDSKAKIIEYIKEKGWDVNYIRSLFSKINSEGIVIRQSSIKTALEDALLNQAVSARMKELYNDNEVKASLVKLYMEYQRTNEVITKDSKEDFVRALKALPIWITTGQSPQAIPMKPGIFDLLIIDEATQCTITSILPLIYRCKKIIVIGDMDQLTAIDNISISAERFIADKFGVEKYLYLLGHCRCNIYKSVLNMIPVKEGNVISLTDHYRSHPLIIGFSNYYVYKNRLVLKKPMKEINQNKVSGVFGINVAGEAHRDRKTDSWCNMREAQEVIRLIQSFKSIPEYSNFSIGVITPFRGQVNLLYGMLEQTNDITNVLVSTVHKYQGDEKDIIIFSPVVAKGMTPSAAKWVENPQNLINVAVTRAKEALYVVSDFEVCRRQPGILGSLIKYTEKIELLRRTSLYELQLFGLMILQGWEIAIHPTIKDIEVDFIVTHLGNRVVVEVDGRQHEKQKVMDHNRDAMLAGNGYGVIRISTREIVDTPFETIERIRESLQNDIFSGHNR